MSLMMTVAMVYTPVVSSRREQILMYGENPGICFQHNQMIKHRPDWEIQRQHVCDSKVHLPVIMHTTQLGAAVSIGES